VTDCDGDTDGPRPGSDVITVTYLVAFDLDGTLVDTPNAIVRTFAAAFEAIGVPPRDPAAIRATIGLPLGRAFGDLLGADPGDERVGQGIREYQAAFRELIMPRAADLVFPGVTAGLDTLRDNGFALAVATSKFHASADALLRAAGLRDAFTVVACADDVSHPKPHPEMGELVMRTVGIGPDRSFMVGNTVHDVVMARAAGMRSIAVTYGIHHVSELAPANPTWTADTFEDVLTCIKIGCAEQA
jgi:phosphoglycolate phosphatase